LRETDEVHGASADDASTALSQVIMVYKLEICVFIMYQYSDKLA